VQEDLSSNQSLFARLGGEAAVEAAVVRFYERVMADPRLAKFFEHLDMGAQIKKQIAFMTMAFGGPNQYSGRDLRTAHAKLAGLGDVHFDAILEHLRCTLVDLQIEERAIAEVIGIVETTRADVLNR
jgi:truncated hemoglobin YjbI